MTSETATVAVPAFCMEPADAARRQLPALARKWAHQFTETGTFPHLALTPAKPGTTVLTESAFDLGGRAGVRLYLISELRSAVQQEVGWEHAEAVAEAFEASLRGSCWGALALVVGHRGPDTITGIRTRIEALLRCWAALDKLKYLDGPSDPISLSELVRSRFTGLMALWLRQPTGGTAGDLVAAFDAVVAANAQACQKAVVGWLAQLVATSQRIRNKSQLVDPTFLQQKLAELEPSERESMELGIQTEALTLLYGLDRELTSRRH